MSINSARDTKKEKAGRKWRETERQKRNLRTTDLIITMQLADLETYILTDLQTYRNYRYKELKPYGNRDL